MVTSEEVTLEAATSACAPVLGNLLEFYLHDMSDIFPIEVGPDGRFGYPRLPLYWSEPDRRFAFLIHAGDKLAGFAFVTRGSPATSDPDDLDLAEFFVLRGYRRSGVGRQAAFLLWDRLPGSWVVRVADHNRVALPFWEDVVNAYTKGSFTRSEHKGKQSMFRVFSFRSGR